MKFLKGLIAFPIMLITYYPCLFAYRCNIKAQIRMINEYKKEILETLDLENEIYNIDINDMIEIYNKLIELDSIKIALTMILRRDLRYSLDIHYNIRVNSIMSSNTFDMIIDDQIKIANFILNKLREIHKQDAKNE